MILMIGMIGMIGMILMVHKNCYMAMDVYKILYFN